MAGKKKTEAIQESQEALSMAEETVVKATGKYINPLTDFGFKYIFGTKEYLMDFLNAVLKIKGGIVDLQYDNTERRGLSEDDRTTVFDLYCTVGDDDRILIEMQLQPQGYFKNRLLYYGSRMIQEQGEGNKGDEWGFDLKKVYSISIVNFRLNRQERKTKEDKTIEKYASYVQLMDKKTRRIFSDRLTFVNLELPSFNKEVDELENSIEEWMYVLKNLARLNDLPEPLRKRYFESLFHKAEIAKLPKEKRKEYNQSVKNLLDMNALIAEKNREIAALSQNNVALSQKNATLSQNYAAISQNYAALSQNNAALQKEIAELRRRLGINGYSQ